MKQKACILVCTQQHKAATAFIVCFHNFYVTSIPQAYVARVTDRDIKSKYSKRLENFKMDYQHNPPSKSRPYLVVTTCLTARHLRQLQPKLFFTHILLDEGAQMREPEAVVPFNLADMNTKIVIAGDKQQVCDKI